MYAIGPKQVQIPPHSPESEEWTLGAIILNPKEAWPVVREIVSSQDFFIPKWQWLMKAFEQVAAGDNLNPFLAMPLLKEKAMHPEEIGDYFHYLLDQTPTAVHANYYAEVVRDLAGLRRGYKPLVKAQKTPTHRAVEM